MGNPVRHKGAIGPGAARPGIPWDGGVGTNVKEAQVHTQGNRKVPPPAYWFKTFICRFQCHQTRRRWQKGRQAPLGSGLQSGRTLPWGGGMVAVSLSGTSLCLTWPPQINHPGHKSDICHCTTRRIYLSGPQQIFLIYYL